MRKFCGHDGLALPSGGDSAKVLALRWGFRLFFREYPLACVSPAEDERFMALRAPWYRFVFETGFETL